MTKLAKTLTLTALPVLLAFFLAIVLFKVVTNFGWLTPFGIESESHDTQVIHAIERTQEVSLVGLGIQGIKDKDENGKIFGWEVPGTKKVLFLKYSFTAKLGIDGADVKVTREGTNTYVISIPDFISIGVSAPKFETAVEDGGILSWTTPDIDEPKMITEILNDDARQKYIDDHEDLLRAQVKVFYDSLITSIDPGAVTKYEFAR